MHLQHGEVLETLDQFDGTENPNAALTMVYIDGELVDSGVIKTDFLGTSSHIEQEISKDDGEAALLSTALTVLKNDLEAKRGWVNVVHELAIVGPAGACDGCKDKIRKFKAAWAGFARKAGYPRVGAGTATLTVSFYYKNSHYNRNRKNPGLGTRKEGLPTKYGWREEVGVGSGFVRTFGKTV